MTRTERKARHWSDAEFFSPKDFVRHAVLIGLAFAVVHACGLREYTSVLNGTTGSMNLGWETSVLLGIIYILFYLAFILVAPMLILAAAILAIARRIFPTTHE